VTWLPRSMLVFRCRYRTSSWSKVGDSIVIPGIIYTVQIKMYHVESKVTESAVWYPAPEPQKMPQQRQAVVHVPSVCWHIGCGTDRPWVVAWKCAVSSLVSVEQPEDCSTEMVSWHGSGELVVGPSRLTWDHLKTDISQNWLNFFCAEFSTIIHYVFLLHHSW